MVRSRFPGKPSKFHLRRKVSVGVNNEHDGQQTSVDTYCRLALFDFLFPEQDQGYEFHGFSPHDLPSTSKCKTKGKNTKKSLALQKKSVTLENIEVNTESEKVITNQAKPEDTNISVSGKFVLPSRSAHSSRVIKPNKRFLETGEQVPEKKVKTKVSINDSLEEKVLSQSPVKCILREPRLNISTEYISLAEGPFSSPNIPIEKALPNSNLQKTKVVCGVCGITCSYTSLRQARRYGIFSCEDCKIFIAKIIRWDREQRFQTIKCVSKTGSCPIRQLAIANQPFLKEEENESLKSRCKGCWLNLCLRSFKLPQELCKRLRSHLPLEYKTGSTSYEIPATYSDSIHTDVTFVSQSLKDVKKKTESKVAKNLSSGPRVKHVCRSASAVLGQPTATFINSGKFDPEDSMEEIFELPAVVESKNSTVIQQVSKESLLQDEFDRPIARMLQDLGRDNCDLLDGVEMHDYKKKFARISIDFWESYDPEEITQTGFSLLGYNPLVNKPLCFLCGSGGYEKMIHCSSCAEPYHNFCIASLRSFWKDKEWWKLDWSCPRCTSCEICSNTGGTQLTCVKCLKNYHTNCVPAGRACMLDINWSCPSCLYCKSCSDPAVHVFVGNMPLCKACFKLRKKGNFCPLCQGCYDENDYDTKMMECAECKCWIHAKCEGLTNEKYQVLSYLPSSVEFICKLCCKNPPPDWLSAVNADLKSGYLNVIVALSKNRLLCTLVKASPKKRVCVCKDSHPIHLRNLSGPQEKILLESDNDLGLLTPKLTKDDEENLISNPGLLNLVNAETIPSKCDEGGNLLSIAFDRNVKMEIREEELESQERKCFCQTENNNQSLSLMAVKIKANNDEYLSVMEFNKDMNKVLEEINKSELNTLYENTLKQVFPWFDKNDKNEIFHEIETSDTTDKNIEKSKTSDHDYSKPVQQNEAYKNLLNHEKDYYYINLNIQDTRWCLFCKTIGDGFPMKEGRLLYCGQNEWVHANCAIWSSEVFEEIDGSLQNVHSAISRSRLIRCSSCDKKGASVGCCAKSCPSAYHFVCAKTSGCIFLETMEVYCKNHISVPGQKEKHKEENFQVARSVYVELDHKKKKDILHNDVQLAIGSLKINSIGEINQELSDYEDFILPCNFKCSRYYWSTKEPWKIVKYHIETKLNQPIDEYSLENDTNFTINHSIDFTPPPSPVERSEEEVKSIMLQLIDTVCDDNTDQQDLLPPDLEEAIFDDLPHDLLDRISMNDIFAVNLDEIIIEGETSSNEKKKKNKPYTYNKLYDKDWKQRILQVDGAMDFSEDSNDSSDVEKPVKCAKCKRTYRTSDGYNRHLPTCTEYESSTDSDCEEDVEQLPPEPQISNVPIIVQQEMPYIPYQQNVYTPVITPVVQNIPIGLLQQPLVLNNTYQPIYQPNVYINSPVIVGMETVVSNTVMQSQYIASPGVVASSYSATTTQVYKPVIEPQYMVVPQQNWNNYVNIQEYKVNKNISYQTVTRQVVQQEYSQPKIIKPEKINQVKIVELPKSSAVHKEKPQQAVAPVVVKKIPEKIMPLKKAPCVNEVKKVVQAPVEKEKSSPPKENLSEKIAVKGKIERKPLVKTNFPNILNGVKAEEAKIRYDITSDDGFKYSTTDLKAAWEKVFATIQEARVSKSLPPLNEHPFKSPRSMMRHILGLGNHSVKYVLEQLPGISGCSKYRPSYHKKKLTALELEMTKDSKLNITGCARSEKFKHKHHKYDMFKWLASRHRRPPKLLGSDSDGLNISRRNQSLPMAMRFRHLKETAKISVGVFRSDIHGRGLFCLRDIESGEMVIEYAGEVIRSSLTDKRERFYTSKGIGCYMFRIDDKFVVDATMKGNAARFINHSCEPNCYSKVVDILGKKHILIFALRKISKGEELTYDYKFPLEEEKINCHCLSRKCRKYLN